MLIGAKAGSGRSSTNPSSGIYGAGQFDGWYAHMVHEGTKFIKKTTPFLSSAFSSNKSSVEGKLGQFLLRKLKRSAKKFGFETL